MARTVIYAATSDAYIQSANSVYATMCAGSSLTVGSASPLVVGETDDSIVIANNLAYLDFNTAAITTTPRAATLSLYPDAFPNGSDLQARPYDFGASVDTTDWRTPAQLLAMTLLADVTASTMNSVLDAAYVDFTSYALAANIVLSGNTRLVIASTHYANSIPPGSGVFETSECYGATGGSTDPKLTLFSGPADGFRTSYKRHNKPLRNLRAKGKR